MEAYVNSLTQVPSPTPRPHTADPWAQPQKWEYKSRSGYGRPDKLLVQLEGPTRCSTAASLPSHPPDLCDSPAKASDKEIKIEVRDGCGVLDETVRVGAILGQHVPTGRTLQVYGVRDAIRSGEYVIYLMTMLVLYVCHM